MAKLILRKTIHDVSREELENFIAATQAKRLAAAVVYYQAKSAKLEGYSDKLADRHEKQTELLGKALDQLDVAIQRLEQRMQNLQEIENEAGYVDDQLAQYKQAEE